MPLYIRLDKGCIQMPSGQRLIVLKISTKYTAINAVVQTMVSCTVRIPPATQMLMSLRQRKNLPSVNPAEGVLLTSSNVVSRTPSLVGALTVVSANSDPFLQVVNAGHTPIVIQEGTVLAHAGTEQMACMSGELAQNLPVCDAEPEWLWRLCEENRDLTSEQRARLRRLFHEFKDIFSDGKYDNPITASYLYGERASNWIKFTEDEPT